MKTIGLTVLLIFVFTANAQESFTPSPSIEWRQFISSSETSTEVLKNEINTLKKIGTDKSEAMIGYIYYYADDFKDYTKSVEISLPLSNSGLALSQYIMAKAYLSGNGVSKDISKGINLYEKAAQKGDVYAQNNLGSIYFDADHGVKRDYEKAAALFKKSADQGNTIACYNLAELNKKLDKMDEAIFYYKTAAKKGHRIAQRKIGLFYYGGKHVAENNEKAFHYLIQAAEQGDRMSQFYIGQMYDRGHGKDRNWKKALNWYNKSADQGYNKAICELGTFYLFGVAGVEKNKSKAVKLFKKAAEKGNDDAELYLQVLDDIEEYKSNPDVVATSKMSKSVMKVDYSDYEGPLVLSSNSWLKKVHYENNTSSTMTIFPTTGVLAERNSLNIKRYPDDEIQYEDYSPCPEIKPSTETYNIAQTHDVFIRNSKPVRTIGYMYIIATFSKFDVPFYIKLPYAFCWPQK